MLRDPIVAGTAVHSPLLPAPLAGPEPDRSIERHGRRRNTPGATVLLPRPASVLGLARYALASAASVATVPARALAALEGMEVLLTRINGVMDRIEESLDRTDRVLTSAEAAVARAEQTTRTAGAAADTAGAVANAAEAVANTAEALANTAESVAGRAAATAADAAEAVARAAELLAAYEPTPRQGGQPTDVPAD
ncbi:hypothetical protein [Salinispora arenicola]|uniref:Methyl-accepting chemotaxis protein n=1 Tax=Salinispora arenicola TaxID=168697 RepID=A0A542XH23_SALAC|nr:hypothetical protein [Salinispora arenicola]TQL35124.1 hypothetical protein FB564_0146 [Salinispora arenicola]GIM83243.1 hypothetical protein Sar04_11250 [Salinispora arenicola]